MNFTIDDVNILYEDNHVIVAVKPQNMPSVPDELGDADMHTVLKEYIKQKENKPGDAFLGVVHRLDRPTGGVMMFAKTSKAAERLTRAVKEREVEKKYLAVINGRLKSDRGTLVNWLRKNPSTNVVSVVTSLTEGAKEARLDYEQLGNAGRHKPGAGRSAHGQGAPDKGADGGAELSAVRRREIRRQTR